MRFDMKKILFLLLFIFLSQACGSCSVQSPREGYIRTSDGVRLFYKIVGSGPDILVAVHGGPGNSMDSILADLEPLAQSRTVIYYDQRGNGRSDLIKDPDKLAINQHIEDLEAVRTHFKLDKVTLLGNSWGAILIAFYAVAYPDKVERMILHSPGEPTKSFMVKADEEMQLRLNQQFSAEQKKRYAFVSNHQNWIKAENPKAVCREFYQLLLPFYVSKPENVARLKGDVCSGSDDAVRYQQFVNEQIMNSLGDWNLLPSLGAVKSPVLVIYGTADPAFVETPEAWAQALPNARLLIIDGAGHLPHVEQPEIFFNAVETFLQGDFSPDAKKIPASPEKN
jgi:proline iminopeptidase